MPTDVDRHCSVFRSPQEGAVSGRGILQVDMLGHLPGAVAGHSDAQGGHRHGDLVDGAARRLELHLTRHLPLQESEVSWRQPPQSDYHCGSVIT